MNFTKIIGLIAIIGIIESCGSKLPEEYHMDKKFWSVEDYDATLRYFKYTLNKEEGYPRLSDPLTAPVFNKLIDKQNVSIVLEDEKLGLKYRDKIADGFWDASNNILKIYQILDIQDKYVYPIELVRAIEFNLHTQLLYFKVGNQKILNETIDPKDPEIKRLIKKNQQAIVDNFKNSLRFLVKEDAFTKEAFNELASVLGVYYTKLVDENPTSNYSEMKSTIHLLINKCKSELMINELKTLLDKIEKLDN